MTNLGARVVTQEIPGKGNMEHISARTHPLIRTRLLHMHGRGGNLNIHKYYSIHPRLKLQRKLNLIVYMSDDWDPTWGGGLEL